MTMADIRRLEDETKEELDKVSYTLPFVIEIDRDSCLFSRSNATRAQCAA